MERNKLVNYYIICYEKKERRIGEREGGILTLNR